MRDVVLPIFAEVRAVGVDDGGGVVVDAGAVLLVQRYDDHHLVPLRQLLHELRRRPVGNRLDGVVPARALLGAEVRTGEDLLHRQDLHALAPRLLDETQVLLDVRLADRVDLLLGGAGVRRLDQSALHHSGHVSSP